MASRPGFPHSPSSPTPPTTASNSSAHVNNILKNYSHEQVVFALLTQLREKESQLTTLTEQRHLELGQQRQVEDSHNQLLARLDACNLAITEKDTRIAQLENTLARGGDETAVAEARVEHLSEINAESKRVIRERDEQLSQLRTALRDMKAQVDENERIAEEQVVAELEEALESVRGELETAREEKKELGRTIEDLEKKLKGKEWMVKSLQDESTDQRSKENHLVSQIKKLEQKIETYETKFEGKGVDVPMLLAKLKDYEVRVKDLQGQVRRLTNKKLNELVLRSTPAKKSAATAASAQQVIVEPALTASLTPPRADGGDNDDGDASEITVSLVESETSAEEEEDGTLVTNESDDMDQFFAKTIRDDDVLSDFFTEVKVGLESLQSEGLCCAQEPPDDGTAPTYKVG